MNDTRDGLVQGHGVPDGRGAEPPAGVQQPQGSAAADATQADVRCVLAGDPAAFDRLWLRFCPALAVLLQSRFRRTLETPLRVRFDDELEDILQNTAVTALRQLGSFAYRGPGSLLAWMDAIAQRAASDRLDYWRAGKRATSMPTGTAGPSATATTWIDRLPATGLGVVTQVHDVERQRQLANVLGDLPERFQTIVMLQFFVGAEWAEVARELGSPSAEAVKMECALKVLPAIAAALRQQAAAPSLRDERGPGPTAG